MNGIALPASQLAGTYGVQSRGSEQQGGRAPGSTDAGALSEAEKRQVQKLKQRDAEVKNHERAHIAAGGPYVSGGANFQYQRGPDGRNYAVGGEVRIDVAPENSPEGTIRKMQVVRRAALAPADPSPQDRSVAARATQVEARARLEKSRQQDAGGAGQPAGATAAPDSGQRPPAPAVALAVSRYRRTATSTPPGSLVNLVG